jgi:hypothetical protein
VSRLLVLYLDAIDENLLEYLDGEEELRPEIVERLRFYAAALLERSITPVAVMEDWEDWFDLVGAFVAVYAPDQLQTLMDLSNFMEDPLSASELSNADRTFLTALEATLGMYPEIRRTTDG